MIAVDRPSTISVWPTGRSGKARPCEVVPEDDRRRRARLHVGFGEAAAPRRFDAEHVEHVLGHPRAFDLLRHVPPIVALVR